MDNRYRQRLRFEYHDLRREVFPDKDSVEVQDWQQKTTGRRYSDNWGAVQYAQAMKALRKVLRDREKERRERLEDMGIVLPDDNLALDV